MINEEQSEISSAANNGINTNIQNTEIRANEFRIPTDLRSQLETPDMSGMIFGLKKNNPNNINHI